MRTMMSKWQNYAANLKRLKQIMAARKKEYLLKSGKEMKIAKIWNRMRQLAQEARARVVVIR